jgi:hypothetical protein
MDGVVSVVFLLLIVLSFTFVLGTALFRLILEGKPTTGIAMAVLLIGGMLLFCVFFAGAVMGAFFDWLYSNEVNRPKTRLTSKLICGLGLVIPVAFAGAMTPPSQDTLLIWACVDAIAIVALLVSRVTFGLIGSFNHEAPPWRN